MMRKEGVHNVKYLYSRRFSTWVEVQGLSVVIVYGSYGVVTTEGPPGAFIDTPSHLKDSNRCFDEIRGDL